MEKLNAAGRALGALCSALMCGLWYYAIASEAFTLATWALVGSLLMMVTAVIGIIASLRGHSNVMLAVFLVSFLPIGVVMIRMEHWLSWIGISNLGLLAASMITRLGHGKREDETP